MLIEKEELLDWTEKDDLNEEHPMSKNHSKVFRRLNVLLTPYEDKFEIMPEFDIQLSSGRVKPDIAICAKGLTFDWWKDETWTKEVPLSVIEILSPTQPLDDIVQKTTTNFFAGGVQSVWLVLPSLQSVYIITADLKRVAYTSGAFTDPVTAITLKVEDIFQ